MVNKSWLSSTSAGNNGGCITVEYIRGLKNIKVENVVRLTHDLHFGFVC